jgi:3-oxoacyl-[acyl-carrier-protein] synthase-1
MADNPCRPFDAARNGISIGEGAAFALLERPHARHDAETILLLGSGETADAYHMSAPHPEGEGARQAMALALADARLQPSAISYINLHGTATPAGDAAEDRAVSALFGARMPCSSTKGATGHTLGASGVIEAIFGALAIRNDFLPGSPHTQQLDPAFRSQYVLAPRAARVDTVMSNSFGFGGVNCSLVLGRAG